MRVLIIHTVYKLKGGEDSVVLNEMELLKSAGADVELLEFSNTGNTLLKVLQLPFNYGSFIKTKKKITSFKPDVVHIHNLHFAGSPSVIYAIKKFNIPIVLTIHNYRLLCPSATLFYNGQIYTRSLVQNFPIDAVLKGAYLNSKVLTLWVSFSLWLHQWLGTWTLVSGYIILGQHTKEIFSDSKLGSLTEKMFLKPNFCFESVKPDDQQGTYYLYVGRLSEEKGLNLLLEAFSENGLQLKIAGGGPLQNDVIARSKVCPNIHYIGSVDKTAVNSLLKDAIALIFPSQWYETFGMVIIEAFSAGVPVIATKLGQMKFTIKNEYNGLLFEPGNKDDLSRKVLFYDRLTAEQKSIYKRNARQSYDAQYSPGKNIVELNNVYEVALTRNL
ncbi:MAG: hypothetical protein JWR12_867 [Mucilaginibacter sp.]|nr:hypothetical protein [Mucilaginibacter sp.]